jgi:hypothetical protein
VKPSRCVCPGTVQGGVPDGISTVWQDSRGSKDIAVGLVQSPAINYRADRISTIATASWSTHCPRFARFVLIVLPPDAPSTIP